MTDTKFLEIWTAIRDNLDMRGCFRGIDDETMDDIDNEQHETICRVAGQLNISDTIKDIPYPDDGGLTQQVRNYDETFGVGDCLRKEFFDITNSTNATFNAALNVRNTTLDAAAAVICGGCAQGLPVTFGRHQTILGSSLPCVATRILDLKETETSLSCTIDDSSIEKVARAICLEQGQTWDELDGIGVLYFSESARAAINAIMNIK